MKHEHPSRRAQLFSGIRYRTITLLACLLLAGCKTPPGETETEIIILSTNDIHARVDQFPKLATFVRRVQAAHPHVLLVDAGDRFTGYPYVDHVEERGKPIITLMNLLGYHLAALGNHEFDYGQRLLRQRIDDATFPFICANIHSSRAVLDTIPPYHTLEIGGIRLCFLGLVQTTHGHPDANPEHFDDITFDDYRDAIPRYRHLRQSCDALVGLTHLGVDADSVLAMSMPELDVIIGGHSHTLLDTQKVVNNVIIGQSKRSLQYAGITTLKFTGKRLTHRSYRSVYIDTITRLDPRVSALVQQYRDNPKFKRVVGHTSRPLSHDEIGALVTESMRVATKSDFAFYNQGGIRLPEVPRGEITMATLLEIEPFDNHVVVRDMSAGEMKDLILRHVKELEYSASTDPILSGGTYSLVRDAMNQVVDVDLRDASGQPLSRGKRYKVALNNYMNTAYDPTRRGPCIHTDIKVIDAVLARLKSRPSL